MDNLTDSRAQRPDKDHAGRLDQFQPVAFDLDNERFPGPATGSTAYELASKPTNAGKINRNRLMFLITQRSDDICASHKSMIMGLNAVVGLGLDESTALFAGAATVVGGELSKSILAGISHFSATTRANFDKNIYQEKLTTAIISAIDGTRAEKYVELLKHLKDSPVTYPVDRMIREVNDYHEACSFYAGITAVAKAASKIGEEAKKKTK